MARILIVDDEPNIPEMLACALGPHGHAVETVNCGAAALAHLRKNTVDLVISDVIMGEIDGFAVLAAARELPRPPEVIIMTGFGSIEAAVEAMKLGAAEYVTKPLDIPKIIETVDNVVRAHETPADARPHPTRLSGGDFAGMVGRSAPMKRLYQLIEQIALSPATVMITGQSGTGKEMVARAIHHKSARSDGPFVAVDCSSLAETLLESELFGHVKGAFTGAVDDKSGLLDAADKGTIFLDEIGEMSPGIQQKLVRTMQEKAVRPIGSTAVRNVDVHVISATNRDLSELVADNKFRQDLYYRLNVVHLSVPPLAERRDDIPLLARHFARKAGRHTRRKPPAISDTVLTMLQKADWPGNVRQLENVIECAVTFAEGDEIRPEHLTPDFVEGFALAGNAAPPSPSDEAGAAAAAPANIVPLGAAIRYLERQMLSKALVASNGNKEQAANMLGIDRATLYRKLKTHNLTDES